MVYEVTEGRHRIRLTCRVNPSRAHLVRQQQGLSPDGNEILTVPKPHSPLQHFPGFLAEHNEQPELLTPPCAGSSQQWLGVMAAGGDCSPPGKPLGITGHILWPDHQGCFSLLLGSCKNKTQLQKIRVSCLFGKASRAGVCVYV